MLSAPSPNVGIMRVSDSKIEDPANRHFFATETGERRVNKARPRTA